jgi:hypothetical protein
MFRRVLVAVLVLIPSLARAADEPPAHRVNGDLAIQARDILRRYCAECHTGSADPGQSKLKLLDYKQLTAKGRPVPFVTPDGRSQVLDLIKDGSMPPANRPAPRAEEIAVLERWVKAAAPAYPQTFDDRYVLEAVADDFEHENAKDRDRRGGEYLRYASFAHLLSDVQLLPDIGAAERQLNDALALSTGGAPVKVIPIDPAATVFRIELARLGWQTTELFEKVERRKSAGAHPLRSFDLLLLDYPSGESRPAGEFVLTNRLEKLLDAKSQVRPVPFVRGDWLASALVNGKKLTPLATDIDSLAQLGKAYSRGQVAIDGPPVPRVLGTAPPYFVPRFADGRAAIPPLSGWYTGAVTPDPAPFTLTAELVADVQPVKGVKVDQFFKLRVSSDRRVYLVLLMIQADGEVRVQDIGDSVLLAKDARELAPGPDGFNISGIVTGGDSATEYFVLFASETQLPLPTIVRSTHSERPVWRFLLEPTAKDTFDPNKVVRRVVPIPVTKK